MYFNTNSISTLVMIAVRLDVLNVKLCPGHAGFSLQVFNHVGMVWVPWRCVCFSVMPHLTDSSCLLPSRTSRPSSQINTTRQVRLALRTPPHVLCLTPQSQMLSIRFTLMDSLRYRLNRHVLVTYDWFCPEEAHNIDQTGSADLFGTLPGSYGGTVWILALIWVNILQNG